MIRLAISVEGQTEEDFVKSVLADHLRMKEVETTPIRLGRTWGTGDGGNVRIEPLTKEMVVLRQSFDAVTSLVDFYGFRDKGSRVVEELKELLAQKIRQKTSGPKVVIPYVQKHEFEGLLFSDVTAFDKCRAHLEPEDRATQRNSFADSNARRHQRQSCYGTEQAYRRRDSELPKAFTWPAGGKENGFGEDSRRVPTVRRMGNTTGSVRRRRRKRLMGEGYSLV